MITPKTQGLIPMNEQDIDRIEKSLNIRLPAPYRKALIGHNLPGVDADHPEFHTDPDLLIQTNEHFILDPDDLADLVPEGRLGKLKFFLLYKSESKLRDMRREYCSVWAGEKRFIIGDDLGEERYYIILTESSPSVRCYQLETGESHEVAPSIDAWLSHIKNEMSEADHGSAP